jgi:hypothetical protein
MGFCLALSLPSWGEADLDWRLIGFSVASETSVFSDSQGQLATYRPGEEIADGQWRLQSIGADHVVLVPARRAAAARAIPSVILGAGDDLPDVERVQPGTSIYYEVQGVFVDDIEAQPGVNDPEETP